MPIRDPSEMASSGEFSGPDPRWDDALDTRRFCWAVLHRLRERICLSCTGNPISDAIEAKKVINTAREFDMYYVTLRRTQSTFRYAQQDPDQEKTPNPARRDLAEPDIASLPPTEDVMFPVPWRVQVYFRDHNVLGSKENPAYLPTEIEVNTPNVATNSFVVDMFSRGTSFVDEVSGQVYRVTRRRITGPDDVQAILTLDREVFIEDLDDSDDPAFKGNFFVDPDEQIRTVWVFPPPVTEDRPDHEPVFIGKQPVVGIEVRTLTISPRG